MQNQLPRFIQYPMMLILSPVVPVLNWLLEILKPQVNVTNSVARWSNTFGIERSEFTTGVAAQEIGSMQISVNVMERLDVGFAKCRKSHSAFYFESMVAMSQSALQLYAIFALKKISSLQAVSLVFSILSMMMTGYVFCRTFALPEMVLTYLFVCHEPV